MVDHDDDEYRTLDDSYDVIYEYLVSQRDELPREVRTALEVVEAKKRRLTPNDDRMHRMYAVWYVECCKAGLIADRRHNVTVGNAYGVDPATVKRWGQRYRSPDLPTRNKDVDLVRATMELHGKLYKDSRGD